MDFTLDELKTFIVKAQAPHAFGTAKVAKGETDGAWTIVETDGNFKMVDKWFGGEPYGGQEVVYYKDKAVWIMVYYGRVYDTELDANDVYNFLRKSLQFPPEDKPYRGPGEYTEGNLIYKNTVTGEIDNYSGEEKIFEDGKEVYSATYYGGLVDQAKDVGF